jgi:hypothetical protein
VTLKLVEFPKILALANIKLLIVLVLNILIQKVKTTETLALSMIKDFINKKEPLGLVITKFSILLNLMEDVCFQI